MKTVLLFFEIQVQLPPTLGIFSFKTDSCKEFGILHIRTNKSRDQLQTQNFGT